MYTATTRAICVTVTPQYLPPALAETIPAIPGATHGRGMAVVCTNFSCQPPITDPDELAKVLSAR